MDFDFPQSILDADHEILRQIVEEAERGRLFGSQGTGTIEERCAHAAREIRPLLSDRNVQILREANALYRYIIVYLLAAHSKTDLSVEGDPSKAFVRYATDKYLMPMMERETAEASASRGKADGSHGVVLSDEFGHAEMKHASAIKGEAYSWQSEVEKEAVEQAIRTLSSASEDEIASAMTELSKQEMIPGFRERMVALLAREATSTGIIDPKAIEKQDKKDQAARAPTRQLPIPKDTQRQVELVRAQIGAIGATLDDRPRSLEEASQALDSLGAITQQFMEVSRDLVAPRLQAVLDAAAGRSYATANENADFVARLNYIRRSHGFGWRFVKSDGSDGPRIRLALIGHSEGGTFQAVTTTTKQTVVYSEKPFPNLRIIA